MKRLASSDSLGALISICPTSEETHHHIYSRDYQSMLDGLDEEGCVEEEAGGGGHVAEKKRRLSVDQVKALERSFEVENKLEPERKLKLAQDLGLQPRQVAVWFQNRRARWKTKQLERDYGLLKSNFDALKKSYDSLHHDKDALLKEIKELRSKLKEEDSITESHLSLSIKEEAAQLSDSDDDNNNKSMDIEAMNPTPSEGLNLNRNNNNNNNDSELKDGSSDSDSSAIVNDDHCNNHSPDASNSSIIQNPQILMFTNTCSNNPSSSPPSIHCFAFSESDNGGLATGTTESNHVYHPQFVKMEEHNFFGGEDACNFFSDEQAPTLHWYTPDQWT